MPSKTETVPATAKGSGDQQIAKSASPEEVEAANEEAMKQQKEQKKAAAEAELAAINDEGSSDRQYVTDEDGVSRLAAAKGQRVPEGAQKMAEKSGGLSNTPQAGPESTAAQKGPESTS